MNASSSSTRTLTHKLLLINGVNLNLLGKREPEIYGHTTLADIEAKMTATAAKQGVELICVQSNHEGQLVDSIQQHGLLADATFKSMPLLSIQRHLLIPQWHYVMRYWQPKSLL